MTAAPSPDDFDWLRNLSQPGLDRAGIAPELRRLFAEYDRRGDEIARHEIEVDDLIVRATVLSGLLRGMARRAREYDQIGDRLRIALDVASAELTDERDEARARVAAVRAVHAEIRVDDEGYRGCVHCGGDYPCDTLQALDGPS